jgi:hypothetical protein
MSFAILYSKERGNSKTVSRLVVRKLEKVCGGCGSWGAERVLSFVASAFEIMRYGKFRGG